MLWNGSFCSLGNGSLRHFVPEPHSYLGQAVSVRRLLSLCSHIAHDSVLGTTASELNTCVFASNGVRCTRGVQHTVVTMLAPASGHQGSSLVRVTVGTGKWSESLSLWAAWAQGTTTTATGLLVSRCDTGSHPVMIGVGWSVGLPWG
jgi:hypothetical protein